MVPKTKGVMTHRQRSWLKNNFIGCIVLIMLTGYFAYDLKDKSNNREDHIKFQTDYSDLKAITYNLVEAYNIKIGKDEKQDEQILELWKCQKRSGGQPKTLLQ
jgi:hypothetical protein